MSSDLIRILVTTVCFVIGVLALVGFPALAVIAAKYFNKMLELDQKSHQQQLAIEQRVHRLEDVLTSLDHDVRVRLGIERGPATPLPSYPEDPGGDLSAPDAQRGQSLGPSRTKAR